MFVAWTMQDTLTSCTQRNSVHLKTDPKANIQKMRIVRTIVTFQTAQCINGCCTLFLDHRALIAWALQYLWYTCTHSVNWLKLKRFGQLSTFFSMHFVGVIVAVTLIHFRIDRPRVRGDRAAVATFISLVCGKCINKRLRSVQWHLFACVMCESFRVCFSDNLAAR